MSAVIALMQVLARQPLVSWSSGWTYVMFGAIIVAIICGTWAGAVGARKGRSMQWWFIIGFFLTIVGVILVYILKPIPQDQAKAKEKAKA